MPVEEGALFGRGVGGGGQFRVGTPAGEGAADGVGCGNRIDPVIARFPHGREEGVCPQVAGGFGAPPSFAGARRFVQLAPLADVLRTVFGDALELGERRRQIRRARVGAHVH